MIYDSSAQWLTAFFSQPELRLDRLLRGYDQVAPYFRSEPSDVLTRIVRARNDAGLRHRADQALTEWLQARLREPAPAEDNRNPVVQRVLQALWAVMRLELPGAAGMLAGRLEEAVAWAEAVSPPDFYDMRAELYLTLAHVQPSRRLLSFWYGLCDQVGMGLLDDRYLDVAVIGLRALPQTEGDAEPGPEVLRGLARWARHLTESEANRERFLSEWHALVALYPRGPDRWREVVAPVLEAHPGKPFVKWWAEAVGIDLANHEPTTWRPGPQETTAVLKKVWVLKGASLEAEIDRFARLHQHYADSTGSAHDLTRAFNVLGNALLNRQVPDGHVLRDLARLALRLAAAAVTRDRNDEPSWALWAAALRKLGLHDVAESVLWEAKREFPENAHFRCELAALLAETGQVALAEALYRETMMQFSNDVVSRNALARLLADHGRSSEAERLYRETMKAFLDNDSSRNDFARLLREQKRFPEAEALYRETMERFRNDPVCRLDLGLMLLDLGRPLAEVEALREELRALSNSRANVLEAHLAAVRANRPRPHGKPVAIPPTAPPDAALWGDLRRSGEAMRWGFLLSGAVQKTPLVLVTKEQRESLRAEAETKLRELQVEHPHHPVVRLVARRYGGAEVAEAIRPARGDYALRLELARKRAEREDFARLLDDVPAKAPITALAWLLADDPDAGPAAEALLRWLGADPGHDIPVVRAFRDRLTPLIKKSLRNLKPAEFLEDWDEIRDGAADTMDALLDLAVLALIDTPPPYVLAGWEPGVPAE